MTSLPTKEQMGGAQNPIQKRKLELERLQDEFDRATGKLRDPTPWHKEPRLSKGKQEALDAQEPKQKRSGGFYEETTEQRTKQEAFDNALKDTPSSGTGTWQAGSVSKKDRLLAWHKSIGSPQHVIDAELDQLEEQEAKK